MVTINATPTRANAEDRWTVYTWAAVTENDAPASIRLDEAPLDILMQTDGTFGGMTMALHGSNNDATFIALKDLDGTDIAHTAAALSAVRTAPLYIKPVRTGGASASLNVRVLVRKMR